jgi:hypothetical protein
MNLIFVSKIDILSILTNKNLFFVRRPQFHSIKTYNLPIKLKI